MYTNRYAERPSPWVIRRLSCAIYLIPATGFAIRKLKKNQGPKGSSRQQAGKIHEQAKD
jgi:hypothetical protein